MKKPHGLTGRPSNASKPHPRTIRQTVMLSEQDRDAIRAAAGNESVGVFMRRAALWIAKHGY